MWTAGIAGPIDQIPGETPEGWETDSAVAGIGVNVYSCEKLALGPYERGPIQILFESHSKSATPDECIGERVGASHTILIQAVVSDAEVAAYLTEAYGMPAKPGIFQESVEDHSVTKMRTWTWSVDGAAKSTVTFPDDGSGGGSPMIDRFWWTRGAGMGRIEFDLQSVDEAPVMRNRVGYGKFMEPMLMAQVNDGDFAGDAQWFPSVTTTNTFEMYADHFCTPP